MNQQIPVHNRTVMQKIYQKNQQQHLLRLYNIKIGNTIRTIPIPSNKSLPSNKKGLLSTQQKQGQIQKNNTILYQKMMHIMNRNDRNNGQHKIQPISRINQIYHNNQKIRQQNKTLYGRLEQQKPTISNKKLYKDRQKNQVLLKCITRYHPSNNNHANPFTTLVNFSKQLSNFKIQPDNNYASHRTHPYSQQNNQKSKEHKFPSCNSSKSPYLSSKHRKTLSLLHFIPKQDTSIHYQPFQQLFKQIPLYKTKKIINNQQCFVQFIRQHNIYKIRVRYLHHHKNYHKLPYQLVIPEKQGTNFFDYYNYNYKQICQMLAIQNQTLHIKQTSSNNIIIT